MERLSSKSIYSGFKQIIFFLFQCIHLDIVAVMLMKWRAGFREMYLPGVPLPGVDMRGALEDGCQPHLPALGGSRRLLWGISTTLPQTQLSRQSSVISVRTHVCEHTSHTYLHLYKFSLGQLYLKFPNEEKCLFSQAGLSIALVLFL